MSTDYWHPVATLIYHPPVIHRIHVGHDERRPRTKAIDRLEPAPRSGVLEPAREPHREYHREESSEVEPDRWPRGSETVAGRSRPMLDWLPTKRRATPDLESASPALLRRRAVATVIDLAVSYFVIETAILAVLMVAFTDYFVANGGEAIALSLVGLAPVYLLYAFAFEWRYGTTPGKKRMGLLVATEDGSRPGLVAVAKRNVLRYIDFLPVGYLLGWLLARRSPQGRRLGDRIAGTLVVRPETASESLFAEVDRTTTDKETVAETEQ